MLLSACNFSTTIFQEILDRTGYTLDVTTGQRKYGGPPPDSDAQQPGPGHEVSFLTCGHVCVGSHFFYSLD